MTRLLVVVAHPDDETIGAGVKLRDFRDPLVLHLTDGAPRDPRWRSRHFAGTREEYARARAEEARAALALSGVTRVRSLDVADLEASFALPRLIDEVGRALGGVDLVLTCAYEGGHPDHDACALAVHAAARVLGVPVLEMPLYHARDGAFVPQTFLDGGEDEVLVLDDAQRAHKQRMFDCYATQRDVLVQFTLERESFRAAPHYDFTSRPHDGELWYERQGWMTGVEWRRLAAAALGMPCAS